MPTDSNTSRPSLQNLFITGLTWASGAAVGVGIQLVVALAG